MKVGLKFSLLTLEPKKLASTKWNVMLCTASEHFLLDSWSSDHCEEKKHFSVTPGRRLCYQFHSRRNSISRQTRAQKNIWSLSTWPRISLRRFSEKVYTWQKSQSRICHLMFSFELVVVDSLCCKSSCSVNKLGNKAPIKHRHIFWEISVEQVWGKPAAGKS